MMKTTERVRRMLDSPLWTNLSRFQRDTILNLCDLCDSCENAADTFGKELMQRKAKAESWETEIERLKNAGDNKTKEILRHISTIEELHEKIKIAKAEAVKKFAEKHKATRRKMYLCHVSIDLFEGAIDNLVEEFTEGGQE